MRCDEVMTTTSPHGSSAARATAANGRPWWRSAVVYQIYPRSFADSNGDGIGDLTGITSKVDYLAELGVDVVWLSPIYPSPQDDNGYDISNYQEIDPVFGTLADFDELLAALHDRGIKLVMDLVVNHTSDEHPWFIESRSSTDNPKRNWYWWRGPREGMRAGDLGAEPTNWQSFFSGSAWEFDEESREYYLHIFSRRQPDLNWENSEVRQAVYAMMRWWLDRGIDGFRMDVINMISKDPALPDGLVRSGLWGDGTPFFVGGPRLHEYLQEMHREVLADRDGQFLTVGEMPFVTVEQARLFTDPARAELDMVFQFEHVWLDRGASKWDVQPLRLRDLKATLGRWQAGLAEVGWNSLYWNNHDQPRSVSRFGDDHNYRVLSAKLLATVLHLHRGLSLGVGITLLAAIAAYAAWCSFAKTDLEIRGWSLRAPGPIIGLTQICVAVIDLGLSASVLWVMLPPEANIGLVSFLGAYAAAVIAGIVSHVPGGIGIFEAVVLATLPDVPRESLAAALLAYRAIYYLVPLLFGAVLFGVQELSAQWLRFARAHELAAVYIAPVVPQIAGSLTFLAGAVLLLSGTTPGVETRPIQLYTPARR